MTPIFYSELANYKFCPKLTWLLPVWMSQSALLWWVVGYNPAKSLKGTYPMVEQLFYWLHVLPFQPGDSTSDCWFTRLTKSDVLLFRGLFSLPEMRSLCSSFVLFECQKLDCKIAPETVWIIKCLHGHAHMLMLSSMYITAVLLCHGRSCMQMS